MAYTLYIIGAGLIFFNIYLSFEIYGYSFSKNMKEGMQESLEKVYQNKHKNLTSKIIFYFVYVYKERILIKLGAIVVAIGLVIDILE